MQEQGLIPGNQYAMWLGPIGYHDYEGLVSTPEEGVAARKEFRQASKIVLQTGPRLCAVGSLACTKPTCWPFW